MLTLKAPAVDVDEKMTESRQQGHQPLAASSSGNSARRIRASVRGGPKSKHKGRTTLLARASRFVSAVNHAKPNFFAWLTPETISHVFKTLTFPQIARFGVCGLEYRRAAGEEMFLRIVQREDGDDVLSDVLTLMENFCREELVQARGCKFLEARASAVFFANDLSRGHFFPKRKFCPKVLEILSNALRLHPRNDEILLNTFSLLLAAFGNVLLRYGRSKSFAAIYQSLLRERDEDPWEEQEFVRDFGRLFLKPGRSTVIVDVVQNPEHCAFRFGFDLLACASRFKTLAKSMEESIPLNIADAVHSGKFAQSLCNPASLWRGSKLFSDVALNATMIALQSNPGNACIERNCLFDLDVWVKVNAVQSRQIVNAGAVSSVVSVMQAARGRDEEELASDIAMIGCRLLANLVVRDELRPRVCQDGGLAAVMQVMQRFHGEGVRKYGYTMLHAVLSYDCGQKQLRLSQSCLRECSQCVLMCLARSTQQQTKVLWQREASNSPLRKFEEDLEWEGTRWEESEPVSALTVSEGIGVLLKLAESDITCIRSMLADAGAITLVTNAALASSRGSCPVQSRARLAERTGDFLAELATHAEFLAEILQCLPIIKRMRLSFKGSENRCLHDVDRVLARVVHLLRS